MEASNIGRLDLNLTRERLALLVGVCVLVEVVEGEEGEGLRKGCINLGVLV